MTYQRNIEPACLSLVSGMGSEDALDDEVEDGIQRAEVGGGDRDEDHGNRRGLDEGLAVRPLYALELGPAGDQEAHDCSALSLDRLGLPLPAPLRLLGTLAPLALFALARPAADLVSGLLGGADVRARRSRSSGRRVSLGLGDRATLLGVGLPKGVDVDALLGDLGLEDIGALRHLCFVLRPGLVATVFLRLPR